MNTNYCIPVFYFQQLSDVAQRIAYNNRTDRSLSNLEFYKQQDLLETMYHQNGTVYSEDEAH